ncbi:MAG: response regulator [Anaerolineae bacterium]
MKRDILVADSDEAFASILKERLEDLGAYQVTIAPDGNALLQQIITHPFDLLIVDVTLEDLSLPELLNRIRALRPTLRIVVIPYPGDQVPSALKDIPAHGLLPKPFIIDELPILMDQVLRAETALPLGQIANVYDSQADDSEDNGLFALLLEKEQALTNLPQDSEHSMDFQAQDTAQLDAVLGQSEQGPERLTILSEEALPVLRDLEHELQATLVMLSSKVNLLAYTGSLPQERAEDFCRFVARRVEDGAQMMRFLSLGEESINAMLDEGEKHRIYTTSVIPAVWLTVVLELRIPVGSLRYHTRKTVERLSDLLKW